MCVTDQKPCFDMLAGFCLFCFGLKQIYFQMYKFYFQNLAIKFLELKIIS